MFEQTQMSTPKSNHLRLLFEQKQLLTRCDALIPATPRSTNVTVRKDIINSIQQKNEVKDVNR